MMKARRRHLFGLSILALSLVAASSIPVESPPVLLAKWGSAGNFAGKFRNPHGVAVDASGNVYVADVAIHRIQKFDGDGGFLLMWGWGVQNGLNEFQICTGRCQAGLVGDGNGQFRSPNGVAVDASGNVYVADTQNHRIQKFNSSGNYLTQWGSQGSGNGDLDVPWGVAVDTSGNVYVADYSNHRIQKFDSNGAYQTQWGTFCDTHVSGADMCDGHFDYPRGVAVDAAGSVYVADYNNHRIQKFEADGTFLMKWGAFGGVDGFFYEPWGVAVDSEGNVYVADSKSHRMQKFDDEGTFLTKWGKYCDTGASGEDGCDGDFYLPTGVAVDATGNVYVTGTYNDRVQKFGSPWLDFFIGEPYPAGGE